MTLSSIQQPNTNTITVIISRSTPSNKDSPNTGKNTNVP